MRTSALQAATQNTSICGELEILSLSPLAGRPPICLSLSRDLYFSSLLLCSEDMSSFLRTVLVYGREKVKIGRVEDGFYSHKSGESCEEGSRLNSLEVSWDLLNHFLLNSASWDSPGSRSDSPHGITHEAATTLRSKIRREHAVRNREK